MKKENLKENIKEIWLKEICSFITDELIEELKTFPTFLNSQNQKNSYLNLELLLKEYDKRKSILNQKEKDIGYVSIYLYVFNRKNVLFFQKDKVKKKVEDFFIGENNQTLFSALEFLKMEWYKAIKSFDLKEKEYIERIFEIEKEVVNFKELIGYNASCGKDIEVLDSKYQKILVFQKELEKKKEENKKQKLKFIKENKSVIVEIPHILYSIDSNEKKSKIAKIIKEIIEKVKGY